MCFFERKTKLCRRVARRRSKLSADGGIGGRFVCTAADASPFFGLNEKGGPVCIGAEKGLKVLRFPAG